MKRKSEHSNSAPEEFFKDGEKEEQIRQPDRSEAKPRRWENQTRIVLDALPALISYVDAKHRYQFVNRIYTNWFGHAREKIIGKHVADCHGGEFSRTIEEPNRKK